MVAGIISFLFGILSLQQFSNLPDISWCWAILSIFLLPFANRYYRILLLFIFGFLWALLRAHWVLDVALPSELEGKDLFVTGVVSGIPLQDEYKTRFEFDIEKIEYGKQNIDPTSSVQHLGKVRLSWFKKYGKSSKIIKENIKSVKAGERWQFWVRLKQPHGFMNPGGFDYEGWLYQNKIRATGYVRINPKKNQYAKILEEDVSRYSFLRYRQNLYDTLNKITANNSFNGILIALAIGERAGISQEQWHVFRSTGTSHLVAISGLHIGLLAGFVYFITVRIWPYFGSAALIIASPRAAALSALLIAAFYAALSGFAVPAQRALIMLSIVMISIFWRRKVQGSQVLSFALLVVLLLDPTSVLAAGFWLSFAAVGIIALAAFGRLKLEKRWKLWGRLQWRISLVLIPLLIFLFQQASLISPFANFIAIPVISFLVVPLVLISTGIASLLPVAAQFLFSMSNEILIILWWLLAWLSELPLSQWYGAQPSLLSLILASIGFILILAPKGWPVKYPGLLLILPLIWPNTYRLKTGQVEFTLLDVGQGLSAVVQTQNYSLVFDTGPKFSENFDTGAAVLVPFLRQHSIKNLDILILSHKDNDHRGGYNSLQESIDINKIYSSYDEPGSLACQAGQHWNWDGVLFEMLNPGKLNKFSRRNNASCVLRISAGNKSLLLSADIEKQAEKWLVQHKSDQLNAAYLVAPHHGSKTSSSEIFLNAVEPDYVFIPVGYKNRYRMPHSTVIQRYKSRDITIFETHKSGAISIKFGQEITNDIQSEYRLSSQKYWNSRH